MQLGLLRGFLVVIEEGSVSRAALRLHLGQSSLTRQIATLEQEIGATLFERTSRGVAPTAAGQALADSLNRPLAEIEHAILRCRGIGRGERAELRIGYLQSLARSYLNPALAALRVEHPEIRVTLLDMCAGSQMRALRLGEIDLALIGHEGRLLARDFYTRKVRGIDVVAALPEGHPLARLAVLHLADLRRELFVGKSESESPGHNEWITQLCRRAGFRPRFARQADCVSQMLSLTVSDGAVALLPEIAAELSAPSIVIRPVVDASAKWDLMVAWQRGPIAGPVKTFLSALPSTATSRLEALKSA